MRKSWQRGMWRALREPVLAAAVQDVARPAADPNIQRIDESFTRPQTVSMPTTSTTNSPDGAEETQMTETQTTSDQLQAKADALIAEIPGVTFGYLGNVGIGREGRYDDRSWYIFLPHPGRVGTYLDAVGGYSTGNLGLMLAAWDRLAAEARRRMEAR